MVLVHFLSRTRFCMAIRCRSLWLSDTMISWAPMWICSFDYQGQSRVGFCKCCRCFHIPKGSGPQHYALIHRIACAWARSRNAFFSGVPSWNYFPSTTGPTSLRRCSPFTSTGLCSYLPTLCGLSVGEPRRRRVHKAIPAQESLGVALRACFHICFRHGYDHCFLLMKILYGLARDHSIKS